MTRERVQRDGFTLAAQVTGNPDGPPILLSNSLGTDLAMWAPQRAALDATHRVIGYDTRGHGDSETPPGAYDFDGLVADALAVLDHFGVERAAMMGLSIGGMTGLGVALTAPDRLTRLICACARADNPAPFVQNWDDRIATIDAHGVGALWEGTQKAWLTPDVHSDRPDLLAGLHATFLRTTKAGYTGCAEALKGLNYLSRLGRIETPVLYIAGEKDMGAAPTVMQAMADATPGATYVEIARAAHIANLNRPEAFTAAVLGFLT